MESSPVPEQRSDSSPTWMLRRLSMANWARMPAEIAATTLKAANRRDSQDGDSHPLETPTADQEATSVGRSDSVPQKEHSARGHILSYSLRQAGAALELGQGERLVEKS